MVVLEQVVAFLKIAPERNEFWLIAMRSGQRSEAVVREPGGKNVDGEMLLALAVDKNRKPINFFDAVVGDGDAADRGAVSVKENIATQILPIAENAV